ncbi:MAG: hypothetical protein PHI49_08620 [Halothiobacillaceae bacterium]|nr:hypothetical protein [Halothiobacillaceae bacterium]
MRRTRCITLTLMATVSAPLSLSLGGCSDPQSQEPCYRVNDQGQREEVPCSGSGSGSASGSGGARDDNTPRGGFGGTSRGLFSGGG